MTEIAEFVEAVKKLEDAAGKACWECDEEKSKLILTEMARLMMNTNMNELRDALIEELQSA